MTKKEICTIIIEVWLLPYPWGKNKVMAMYITNRGTLKRLTSISTDSESLSPEWLREYLLNKK